MKKIIFIAMALVCAYATGFAQGKAPAAVTTAFSQKFPNATNIEWDKESTHEYEAAFEWMGEKHSANFSDTGEWLETETTSSFDKLPAKVQTAFNASQKGTTIKAVSKIETSKGITKYEVEIKKAGKTIELFYSAVGSELKE